MVKDIWRNDRVRIISGEHIGKEGVVWDRRPERSIAKRLKVVLDGHPKRGKSPGIWFKVSEVELIELSRVHRNKLSYRLILASQENDDQ